MTHSGENRAFPLQGALMLDGFQQDLFDTEDVLDGVAVSAAEEVAEEWMSGQSDGLFSLDQIPTVVAAANGHNPALRLLEAPVREELARLDAASRHERDGCDSRMQVEVLVQLEAAGHALLVASTIEREIRRCERAAQRAVTFGGRDAAAVTHEFVRELSTAPHPWGIKNDGLRLTDAAIKADGRLRVRMTEPQESYVSLTLWPRLVIAFATSAIVDERFAFSDGSGWAREIRLPMTRLKAIAGGLPCGALEVRLRGGIADLTTRA